MRACRSRGLLVVGVVLSVAAPSGAWAVEDQLTCFGKAATMIGTAGDDLIIGTSGDDVIVGLDGRDRIEGLAGADLICGGGNSYLVTDGRIATFTYEQLSGGDG